MQELERAAEGEHGTLAELTQEAAGEIAIQVARLHQTASSFSNLVALESWDGDCVDLAQVVDEALVGLGVLGRRGIDCRFSKPSQPALVRGDRAWLRRAVGNLIDNSLKVTKSWIHIDLEVVDNEALLTIADDGAGVPPQLLGELFRPHFSTTSGGSGLGLSLVQTVIQRCGGQVVAENGDAGLVVRIRLPRMRIATGDDASTSPV
jgi:signal transduction histidine kinase